MIVWYYHIYFSVTIGFSFLVFYTKLRERQANFIPRWLKGIPKKLAALIQSLYAYSKVRARVHHERLFVRIAPSSFLFKLLIEIIRGVP